MKGRRGNGPYAKFLLPVYSNIKTRLGGGSGKLKHVYQERHKNNKYDTMLNGCHCIVWLWAENLRPLSFSQWLSSFLFTLCIP